MTEKATQPAFAVSIEEAAHMVGISESRFYEDYLHTQRLRPLEVGARRLIVVSELRDAFAAFVAEKRAAPVDTATPPPTKTSRASRASQQE